MKKTLISLDFEKGMEQCAHATLVALWDRGLQPDSLVELFARPKLDGILDDIEVC